MRYLTLQAIGVNASMVVDTEGQHDPIHVTCANHAMEAERIARDLNFQEEFADSVHGEPHQADQDSITTHDLVRAEFGGEG